MPPGNRDAVKRHRWRAVRRATVPQHLNSGCERGPNGPMLLWHRAVVAPQKPPAGPAGPTPRPTWPPASDTKSEGLSSPIPRLIAGPVWAPRSKSRHARSHRSPEGVQQPPLTSSTTGLAQGGPGASTKTFGRWNRRECFLSLTTAAAGGRRSGHSPACFSGTRQGAPCWNCYEIFGIARNY